VPLGSLPLILSFSSTTTTVVVVTITHRVVLVLVAALPTYLEFPKFGVGTLVQRYDPLSTLQMNE
jgi:hypothetical protein